MKSRLYKDNLAYKFCYSESVLRKLQRNPALSFQIMKVMFHAEITM